MREKIYFNDDWSFTESFSEEITGKGYDDTPLEKVRLPHTVKITPFNYFDESVYQMVSGYRKSFAAPKEWEGKSVRLTFEGVAHEAGVYLNGEKLYTHQCGYTAFTVDLSEKLKYGERNVIALSVDSRESLNQPPFGFVIDYMTYGGIYRECYFEVTDKIRIEDAFLYSDTDLENGTAILNADVELAGEFSEKDYSDFLIRVCLDDKEIGSVPVTEKLTKLSLNAGTVKLWDTQNPNLYDVKVLLSEKTSGTVIDETKVKFGFRKSEFKKDGYYLNGRKFKIRGLNRHQSYPYIGYAAPRAMQEMDADVLKNELGLNAVRTSHYPQSHHFISRCDELGLLVFTEIPGWQHIGDDVWKEKAIENVKDMVKQYRNHPSIILWGVRINESIDDDAFYEKTNNAARELDPTRPTGGVRALKKSNLLEDVYTYNDFVHEGDNAGCEPKKNVTGNIEKPYLISEYNGHMYPTKAFDDEEQRRNHAIRHANVLDAVANEADIAGSFGWCMSDYNTHKDFGSGDRICYHGVLDMYRNFKQAGYVYAAQGAKEPVLIVSSSMDIGEHPASNRGIIWIYTNADSVKMYKNGRFIKEYFSSDSPYKNLPHGPIMVDDFIGDAIETGETGSDTYKRELKEALNIVALYGMSHPPKRFYMLAAKLVIFHHMNPADAVKLYNKYIGDWGGQATEYRFEAVKNGEVIKTLVKKPFEHLKLEAVADHTALCEKESYDMAAIRIRATDENGNTAHFFNEPLHFETKGDIELVGENCVSFKGGMCGAYVKTVGKEGKGELLISNPQTGSAAVYFTVGKEKINAM
ncbi:MAG: glycoside hydrolase family 2 protein [Lachnospiraceae bacterium]|nr:glycoside hydrolase family 2 protein [Lachnospiraceae bacterium]